jgi:hypothetical protein
VPRTPNEKKRILFSATVVTRLNFVLVGLPAPMNAR